MRARNFMLMVIGAGIAAILVFFTFVAASCRPRISAQEMEIDSNSIVTTSDEVKVTLLRGTSMSIDPSTLEVDNKPNGMMLATALFAHPGSSGLYRAQIYDWDEETSLSIGQFGLWHEVDYSSPHVVRSTDRGHIYVGQRHMYVAEKPLSSGMPEYTYNTFFCECWKVRDIKNLSSGSAFIFGRDGLGKVGGSIWTFTDDWNPNGLTLSINALATYGNQAFVIFEQEIGMYDMSGDRPWYTGSINEAEVSIAESTNRQTLWLAREHMLTIVDFSGRKVASWAFPGTITSIRATGDYVVIVAGGEVFVTSSAQIHRTSEAPPPYIVRLAGEDSYTAAQMSQKGIIVAATEKRLEFWGTSLQPVGDTVRGDHQIFLPTVAQPTEQ